MARISVDDLRRLMDEGQNPIVLDVRTDKGALARSAPDPGRGRARRLRTSTRALKELPRDREIILYCT